MTYMTRTLVLAALVGVAVPVSAQEAETASAPNRAWTPESVPVDPFAAPAPFGPGEHLVYKVKVGIINAGYGYMSVQGTEDVRENPSYRVEMGIQGGIGPLKVRDIYQSWFDVSTFQSWRYKQDLNQVSYHSIRHYEMVPDSGVWHRYNTEQMNVPLGSALPMDEIAFIYFMRTLDLEVGQSYTFNRYFKEDGNPVILNVVRRDQREVEGEVYNTIVVEPLIRTSGLFGEGGNAELHFTDDERRILVYMKSNIPKFPGSLTLHLQTIQEGFPLNQQSRDEALAARAARAAEEASQR